MSTEIRNIFTSNQSSAIRDANTPSAANVFATMADIGGAGSDIYTADGTIGSSRIATLTDTLTFAGANTDQVFFGTTYLKTVNAGYTSYAIYVADGVVACQSGGAFQILSFNSQLKRNYLALYGGHYLQSTSAGLWTIADTEAYNYDIGARFGIVTLGSTSATTGFLVQNSSATDLFKVLDDGTIGVSTSTPDASTLLDLSSTTKGFLQPRMTGAEVEAIGTPATGLQAYSTSAGAGDVTGAGWWGYDGANWVQGFSGGGAINTLYSSNDTIGSGRVATITDTLTLESVDGVASYGGFVFKPALNGIGANEYATLSYGAREWMWTYRANETYGFGRLSNDSNQFLFNTGALNNGSGYPSQCFVINAGGNTTGLRIIGSGSTSATNPLLIRNSSNDELLNVLDDGGIGVGTATPDTSALIDMISTTKGFLLPKMTTTEMNAIGTPASGLMVFDRTTSQWMGYNGTSWVILG